MTNNNLDLEDQIDLQARETEHEAIKPQEAEPVGIEEPQGFIPQPQPQIIQQQPQPQPQPQQKGMNMEQIVALLATLNGGHQPSFEEQLAGRFAKAFGDRLGEALIGSMEFNFNPNKFNTVMKGEDKTKEEYREADYL